MSTLERQAEEFEERRNNTDEVMRRLGEDAKARAS